MSMTRGNAHQYLKKVYLTTKNDSYREALSVALSALRPVSREQVEKAGAGRRRCMGKTNAKASKTQAEIAAASRRENMERIAREAGLARAAGMSYGAWKARTGNKEDI